MKLNKLVSTLALLAVSAGTFAQTVSLNCESAPSGMSASTTNNRNYYIANCWVFGAVGFINTNTINGSYSAQSSQATNPNPVMAWTKSPWFKPGTGDITMKAKLSASNGTTRVVTVYYVPYDVSANVYAEGTPVLIGNFSWTSINTTVNNLSFTIPAAIENSTLPYKILIGFSGTGGNSRIVIDDLDIPGTYWSDPSSNCLPLPTIQDADSDGVADAQDAYPNDATRAYNNWYPAAGKGTLMFEDLWPTTGDYDFNDYVASYRYNIVTNAANKVVELKLTLTTRAIGASLKNGFGLQLDYLEPSKIVSVTGTQTHNAAWVSNASNGTENGQDYANIILFDDAFKILPSPGGSGVNVDPNNPYATPVDLNVTVIFNTASGQAVGINDFRLNPYLIVNQDRGREVHLPDNMPTSKANQDLFGTGQDDSTKGLLKSLAVKYYKTKNNLPWALAVEAEIPYPLTKVDILEAYPHFAQWAESFGSSYVDWYLDQSGYRNNSKLYDEP